MQTSKTKSLINILINFSPHSKDYQCPQKNFFDLFFILRETGKEKYGTTVRLVYAKIKE